MPSRSRVTLPVAPPTIIRRPRPRPPTGRRVLVTAAAMLGALAAAAGDASGLAAQQLYDFGAAFGRSAAIAGEDILVAEPQAVTRPGRVYVFREGSEGAWVERAVLTGSGGARGDGFGRALAAAGDLLLVGAPRASDGRGAVYLFGRAGGDWVERARFDGGTDAAAAGSAVAVSTDLVAFTEELEESQRVRVFARRGGHWTLADELQGEPGDLRFGAALAALAGGTIVSCGADAEGRAVLTVFGPADNGGWLPTQRIATGHPFTAPGGLLNTDPYVECDLAGAGDLIAVGAPRADNGIGRIEVYERDGEGRLQLRSSLRPFFSDGINGAGTAVAIGGDAVWAGAPGSRGRLGTALRFERGEEGLWRAAHVANGRGRDFMPVFGLALAAAPGLAVVGAPGDDYGAGTALVFRRGPDGRWDEVAELTVEGEGYDRVAGERVECEDGAASVFTCSGMDLVSLIPVRDLGASRGSMVNDVWGWTDPETGREYAVVGRSDGTSFVDVTDPADPLYLGSLPKTEGSRGNAWRDVKVIRDHAVVVADNAGQHGMQVFDMTRLRDVDPTRPQTFDADALYTRIASAHNVVVNEETGFAYTVGNSGGGQPCGSLHMIDMRDPKNPRFAGCYTDPAVGLGSVGGTHDAQCVVYRGPDERYDGREICVGFSETAITIGDVTDKEDPEILAQGRYPSSAYVHQGWLTDDHRYLYINDELDEMNGITDRTRTLIWDLAELDDPVLVGEYLGETSATDHNLYVRGNLMYQSNYAAGLRLIDITDPENPREVGFFDTAPYTADGPGFFDGSWSNYPFFESGNILVTSHKQGLFVLRRTRPIS